MSLPPLHALTLHGVQGEPNRQCDIETRRSDALTSAVAASTRMPAAAGRTVKRTIKKASRSFTKDMVKRNLKAVSAFAKRVLRRREEGETARNAEDLSRGDSIAEPAEQAVFPETVYGMTPNNKQQLLDDMKQMFKDMQHKELPWSISYKLTPEDMTKLQERETELCEKLIEAYGDPNLLGVSSRRRTLKYLREVGISTAKAGDGDGSGTPAQASVSVRRRTAFDAYQWLIAADIIHKEDAGDAEVPVHVQTYRDSLDRLRDSYKDVLANSSVGGVHPFDDIFQWRSTG